MILLIRVFIWCVVGVDKVNTKRLYGYQCLWTDRSNQLPGLLFGGFMVIQMNRWLTIWAAIEGTLLSNTGPIQSSEIIVKSKLVFNTTWQEFSQLHVIMVLCSIIENFDLFYFLGGNRDFGLPKRQEFMSHGSQSIQVLSCNMLNLLHLLHFHVVAWSEGLGFSLILFFFHFLYTNATRR